jgi:hypothetical protein
MPEREAPKELKPFIRGVSKQPRQTFAEPAGLLREGKKMAGVPPNAQWTKIARRIVNPAALEKAYEKIFGAREILNPFNMGDHARLPSYTSI